MSLRKLIQDAYQERVALAPIPRELRDALKSHERIPVFFSRLERELAVLPERFRDQMTIKEAVYSLTDVYIMNVKRVADERQMSDLARSALLKAAADKIRMEAVTDRMLAGESVDLSEIIDG